MQAHYPLIQRVASAATDAANGTATQAGGPYRYLLQANYTGAFHIYVSWYSHTKTSWHLKSAGGLVTDHVTLCASPTSPTSSMLSASESEHATLSLKEAVQRLMWHSGFAFLALL